MSVWQGLEKWILLTAGGTVLVCSFEDNLAICIKSLILFKIPFYLAIHFTGNILRKITRDMALLVWLRGLSAGLPAKRSPVLVPVRAHAWVALADQVLSRGHSRGNHTLMFLSPFLPLFPSLKISK